MKPTNNSKTINAYDDHVQEYIDGTTHTVNGTVQGWLDRTFADVVKDAYVLELGSGFGRDAVYLQKLGYKVQCTDATPGFVELLRTNGLDASVLNAITDEFPSNIDVVVANAVLLHFTREETAEVLRKVFGSLKPGGTFSFTLKQGEGEEWSDAKLGTPRFFCYWNKHQITELLVATGFKDIEVWADQKTKNASWLQIIVKKPA